MVARNIREDLTGVVQAYERDSEGKPIGSAYSLPAGADVPEGVEVPEYLLQPVDGPELADGEHLGGFNPQGANIGEVNAYLDTANPAEKARVLDLEVGGHNRKGIVLDGPHASAESQAASKKKAAEKSTAAAKEK